MSKAISIFHRAVRDNRQLGGGEGVGGSAEASKSPDGVETIPCPNLGNDPRQNCWSRVGKVTEEAGLGERALSHVGFVKSRLQQKCKYLKFGPHKAKAGKHRELWGQLPSRYIGLITCFKCL